MIVTDRSPTIPQEWTAALREALGVFGELVLEPSVTAAWSHESDLPGYTVGGLAGHVVTLMVGLERRIESGGAPVTTIPYVSWYAPALSSGGGHAGLIEAGEEVAARGPAKVAAELQATGARLERRIRTASCDLVIPLASVPGAGVRLDDFLRTRFVEITVHADDIASSVGLPCPGFPPAAWALAAGVVSEAMQVEGSGAAFVLDATRPGRKRR